MNPSFGFAVLLAFPMLAAAKFRPDLPSRKPEASSGPAFLKSLDGLTLAERENRAVREVLSGNTPDFWRNFVELRIEREIDGGRHAVILEVASDYLAIGGEADFVRMPLSPGSAWQIATALHCVLPTRRVVDEIFAAAPLKLVPQPLPPSSAMTSLAVFVEHQAAVQWERTERLLQHPWGVLTAGCKKDVVVSPQLAAAPGKVAIYGWHRGVGRPIQPLYLGHTASWVDYSHGIRLIADKARLDGRETTVSQILADPKWHVLLSDEGAFDLAKVRNAVPTKPPEVPLAGNECLEFLQLADGVRVGLLRTVHPENSPANPTVLLCYAVPNGNSIELTLGRRLAAGDDWHFDIQHIAAQVRWLRSRMAPANLVLACFECAEKSWPAWRKTHDPDNKRIAPLLTAVRERVGRVDRLILASHSGGGAFVFGYLDAAPAIPDTVERLIFLDSNYAYSTAKGHAEKIAAWLGRNQMHRLIVVAYHDSVARLNGKAFVSESGGSWGRSHAMMADLEKTLPMTKGRDGHWETATALDGRVRFLLHTNPDKKILHTRLVEWNGLIHGLLSGTDSEGKDYQFGGDRAYGDFVLPVAP